MKTRYLVNIILVTAIVLMGYRLYRVQEELLAYKILVTGEFFSQVHVSRAIKSRISANDDEGAAKLLDTVIASKVMIAERLPVLFDADFADHLRRIQTRPMEDIEISPDEKSDVPPGRRRVILPDQ